VLRLVIRSKRISGEFCDEKVAASCDATGYRNQVPSWRADVWTVLEQDPELTIAEIALVRDGVAGRSRLQAARAATTASGSP